MEESDICLRCGGFILEAFSAADNPRVCPECEANDRLVVDPTTASPPAKFETPVEEIQDSRRAADEVTDASAGGTHVSAGPGEPRPEVPNRELLESLGSGGMGVVYRARHLLLNRAEAVKLILPIHSQDSRFATRFIREMQLQSTLDHPGIVRLYEAGRVGDRLFAAMEFIDGQPLDEYIGKTGLEVREAVRIVLGAARGLNHAHRKGLIHRDVKPANIMVLASGQVKLLDFGLARPVDGAVPVTGAGQVVGTLAFMSPEQSSGSRDLDGRTDVYALGLTLYCAVTGRTAIDSVADSMDDIREACSPLVDLIQEMIELNRDQRLSQMAQVVERLEEIAWIVDAEPHPSQQTGAFQGPVSTADDPSRAADQPGRNPLAPIIASLAILLAAFLVTRSVPGRISKPATTRSQSPDSVFRIRADDSTSGDRRGNPQPPGPGRHGQADWEMFTEAGPQPSVEERPSRGTQRIPYPGLFAAVRRADRLAGIAHPSASTIASMVVLVDHRQTPTNVRGIPIKEDPTYITATANLDRVFVTARAGTRSVLIEVDPLAGEIRAQTILTGVPDALACSAAGIVAVAIEGGSLMFYDPGSGKSDRVETPKILTMTGALEDSESGRKMFALAPEGILVLDPGKREIEGLIPLPVDFQRGSGANLTCSPDGQMLCVTDPGLDSLLLLGPLDDLELRILPLLDTVPGPAIFLPDGQLLVPHPGGRAILLDGETGRVLWDVVLTKGSVIPLGGDRIVDLLFPEESVLLRLDLQDWGEHPGQLRSVDSPGR